MSKDKMIIETDITDWKDEALQNETIVTSEDDIIEALESKHSAEVARAAVVSKEMGELPDDVIRAIKLLIQIGAQVDIVSIAHKPQITVTKADGSEEEIEALTGRGNTKEEDNGKGSFVPTVSEEGLKLSERYLRVTVMGWIHNHLLKIHANDGDVSGIAKELKQGITKVVNDLSK